MSQADDALRRPRLAVAAALAAPVVALGAVPALQFADWAWVSLCLAAPVVVWGAAPFHRTAWHALRRGTATTETLVSAAVLAALGWSVALLSPGETGTVVRRDRLWALPGHGPAPGEHLYLAVAVVLTVVALAGRSSSAPAPARGGTMGVEPYAVLVAVLAGGAFGFWLTAGGPGTATGAAAAVLVAACPVALTLAGPAAHLVASRRGARLGVGVRTPAGLDGATQVDTIVLTSLDLTGAGPVVEPSAAGAVAALRSLGLRTVLLTTDDPQGSLVLAGRVGIAEVFAEIVPRDRVTVVRRLQNEGRTVAFVGDAADVHDRSALAQADLGLTRTDASAAAHPATGCPDVGGDPGTDVNPRAGTGPGIGRAWRTSVRDDANRTGAARGDGDIGMAGGDLWNATDAVRLARATRRTAGRNRALAFAGSGAVLPLAAAGLLTPLVVLAAPALAAFAIVVSSLRLRSFRSARPPAHQRP